jgi:hypothetical protein
MVQIKDRCCDINSSAKRPRRSNQLKFPLTAGLTGSHGCEALGIVATGHAPVLRLCTLLINAGYDPAARLEVRRGATLALTVRSLGEGARLTVEDNRNGRPRFRLARQARNGAALPTRKNGRVGA